MKLRTHLFLLTLATAVPIVLFAAGLIGYHARLERASVERGMRDTARALTLALDRDLGDIKSAVETLAASEQLDDPADLRAFYDEAATVSKSFGGWAVLSEPAGQQALNTSRRFGDVLPMPSAEGLAMIRRVAESRQTFVSNVFIGTVSRRPAVIIAVPVVRDERVRYVLDFPFEPRQFTRLLQEAALSPGWIATIIDRDGGTVGRVPEHPETAVGRKASPVWMERTTGADEGFFRSPLRSEPDVYAAYKRSKESGWIVGVVAPVELVEASARRALLVLSAGGVVLLILASAVAVVLGKRIAEPIVALADSLKSQTPRTSRPRATVREIEELRHALDEAMARRRQLETEQLARAAAEERAEREQGENRAKDDFLAVLSHELRTPLNSMLGWVRLLKGGGLDPARAAHGLDVIERNVGQQARLISDLLDVSRIVVGRLELAMQTVDLPALAAAVAEAVRPAAEAKEITLTSRLDADAGPVRGDPERLRQVIENLLGNAIKFTPRGGAIVLELERDGGRARLRVTDNGKGIGPDFLPHIFERFRQADSTSTRAHAGLGLGLAIVRHLVELHGGSAAAESAGEGKGATFTVTLPIARAARRRSAGGERAGGTSYPLAGVTVLVVDDDADTRNLLATVLAQHGAVPTTAIDAGDGMTALRRLPPDVLVCDISMPGGDGYALVAQVRAWEATTGGRVPALALTAYARPEDRERALTAGFDLHLAKPVEPADLLAAVARLAGREGHPPGSAR
jgi:signal transduction histidine kinase/ActR/RegA family two-component response regulator